ncbi:hypothetical protein HOS75_gp063 [Gordonia phage SteveFrench]|uniref:Uncharacterized protein n=2 Tax=Montyvirus stevefrench TaxID=2734258 RepID=A0A890UTW0_9CAUD|nr:hypothetical protein HOS75_gp063 [Gordonia phage SteveFrench]AUV60667.1 hypothetical protein SEA_STEVEFRENCH_65 [Gordonia phage SteveFrench]QRI45650.1 hypothetical protein SEA_ROYALG_66 [Gordonia phage RoyalG]
MSDYAELFRSMCENALDPKFQRKVLGEVDDEESTD